MITLVLNSNRIIASDVQAKPFLCADLIHNFDKAASKLDFFMLQSFDVILDGADSFDALVQDMAMGQAIKEKLPLEQLCRKSFDRYVQDYVSACMDDEYKSFTKDDLEHFRFSACNEIETEFMQIYNECRLDALDLLESALDKYSQGQFLILDV
jgi:hypothetical protein